MFQKGIAKMGGRKAGTPNRLTSTFREAVLLAYDNVGGHEVFTQWARENPTEFYKIAARLIPSEMGTKDEKIVVIVNRGNEALHVVEKRPVLEDNSMDEGEAWGNNYSEGVTVGGSMDGGSIFCSWCSWTCSRFLALASSIDLSALMVS